MLSANGQLPKVIPVLGPRVDLFKDPIRLTFFSPTLWHGVHFHSCCSEKDVLFSAAVFQLAACSEDPSTSSKGPARHFSIRRSRSWGTDAASQQDWGSAAKKPDSVPQYTSLSCAATGEFGSVDLEGYVIGVLALLSLFLPAPFLCLPQQ